MKLLRWMFLSLPLAIWQPPTAEAGSESPDSLGHRSAQALVVEMARLIKQHAYFNGLTAVFRYDAWADTTQGLKLHVGEQVAILGDRSEPQWYSIDFTQPIKPTELKLVMGRNHNFFIDASKKITRKTPRGKRAKSLKREKPRRLLITFFTNKNKRTTDFGQLHDQLTNIINQLISR